MNLMYGAWEVLMLTYYGIMLEKPRIPFHEMVLCYLSWLLGPFMPVRLIRIQNLIPRKYIKTDLQI